MNEELLKLRRTLVSGFLMFLIGIITMALFLILGVVVFHPLISLVLLIAGVYIFCSSYKKVCTSLYGIDEETPKEDKKLKDDGWEYLGEGCYCPARAREDRDEEIKRRAENEAYWKNNPPKEKKEK